MKRIKSPGELVPGRYITLNHAVYGQDVYRVCFPGVYWTHDGVPQVLLIHEGCLMGVPHTLYDLGLAHNPHGMPTGCDDCEVWVTYDEKQEDYFD